MNKTQWEEEFEALFKEPPIWPVSSDFDNGYLEGYEHGRGLSKMQLKDFIRSQIEKARKEERDGLEVIANERDGHVVMKVDYAANRANAAVKRQKDEWYEMGKRAGLERAIELVPRRKNLKEHYKVTSNPVSMLANGRAWGWNLALSEVRKYIQKELEK